MNYEKAILQNTQPTLFKSLIISYLRAALLVGQVTLKPSCMPKHIEVIRDSVAKIWFSFDGVT